MSANLAHTLDAGQTSGTPITAVNSAVGGNQFDTVTGSPTYTSSSYRGNGAAAFATTASAVQVSLNWTTAIGTALPHVYGRAILKPTALTGITPFCRCRGAATQSFRVVIGTDGKISIRNTISGVVVTSTNAMTTANTWLIRWEVTVGSSSTCVLYIHTDPTSATPTETLNGSAANFATANIDEVNWGVGAATSNAGLILDDIMFTSVAVPGPPAQFLTVSESITITDATVRAFAAARAATDTTTISDANARAFAAARTAADSTTIADSVVRALAAARPASDTTTIVDGAARGLVIVRASATTTTVTDSVTRALAAARTAAQTTTISDAADRAASAARARAETVNVADSVVAGVSKVRTAGDTVTVTDSADRTSTSTRLAPETVVVTDSASAALAVSRPAATTTTIIDAAIRTLAATRTVSDLIAIADNADRSTTAARAVADTVDIDDQADSTFVPGGAHAPGRGTPTLRPGAKTALLDRPRSTISRRNGASLR